MTRIVKVKEREERKRVRGVGLRLAMFRKYSNCSCLSTVYNSRPYAYFVFLKESTVLKMQDKNVQHVVTRPSVSKCVITLHFAGWLATRVVTNIIKLMVKVIKTPPKLL